MGILEIIGGILLIISSILIIIVVCLQESKQSGVSAMTGTSDSYLSKNRGRTMDSKLVSITRICAIVFFVLTVALNLIITYMK